MLRSPDMAVDGLIDFRRMLEFTHQRTSVPWHRRSRPVDDMPLPSTHFVASQTPHKLHNLARSQENLALGASSGDRRKRITREARPCAQIARVQNGRRNNAKSVEETSAPTDNREQIAVAVETRTRGTTTKKETRTCVGRPPGTAIMDQGDAQGENDAPYPSGLAP